MAGTLFTYPPSSTSSSNSSIGTNGSLAPTSSTEVGGIGADGNLHALTTDNNGSLNVILADRSASGALGALNATVPVVTNGAGTVIAQLSGVWVGTVTFEGSNDGFVTSQAIIAVNLTAGGAYATTATINGFYSILPQGFAKVQARMSAYTSGSATAALESNVATRVIVPVQGVAGNLQMTANQTTGTNLHTVVDSGTLTAVTAITNALPTGTNTLGSVKVTDGTNTGTVKAASTAAVAADQAQVVALSPNNNTLANALITKVSDGTNTSAVKAASTAAVAADPALVVALSPNNNTLANALITKVSDGTNTAAVKAASTAPAATDTALVVSVSPNSADPALGTVAAGTAATKSYLTGGVFNTALPSLTTGQQAALQLDASGRLINGTSNATIGSVKVTDGTNTAVVQGTSTQASTADAALTVTLSPNQCKSPTATLSNVASSATNVTLLASNTARKQATFFNESTQICYLKFGATASVTSYTIQMAANSYYELPAYTYNGKIDALWASANGNMRVTELT